MVKITKLEAENIKRVRAVTMKPAQNGLTVIGGRNGQGKTSVLDAIIWGLGGDKYRPSHAQREGSVLPPHIRIELDNGIIVERKGKNSELKVTDPTGRRAGQQLLNEFVEQFALDLPKFMEAGSREKAQTLLRIIGVEQELAQLDRRESELYSQRTAVGRICDQKEKFAQELPYYDGVPEEPISAGDLIRQQQEILLRNAENARKRGRVRELGELVSRLEAQKKETAARLAAARTDLETAKKSSAELRDESVAELEDNIERIDLLNSRIRANLDRERAQKEAQEYARQYAGMTAEIEEVRRSRKALLDSAEMPLEGLSVEQGELTYHGAKWDCMSSAEQLCCAAAIVRTLNPKCGFILLDKLEQMDPETLHAFGRWLEQEDLQGIATRVSTGKECTLIIEDGQAEPAEEMKPVQTDWKGGF